MRAWAVVSPQDVSIGRPRLEEVEPQGLVRVTATPDSGSYFVERVVPRSSRASTRGCLGYEVEDVLDPAIDVAIRVRNVRDDRLVGHKIATFRFVAVASAGYLAEQPVRRVSELSQRDCLVFSNTETRAEWTFAQREVIERVTVGAALSVQSFGGLLHAAAFGAQPTSTSTSSPRLKSGRTSGAASRRAAPELN